MSVQVLLATTTAPDTISSKLEVNYKLIVRHKSRNCAINQFNIIYL